MRIIDCYYIKGYGRDSKCTKIHGVGIAYNVLLGISYCKAVTVASGALSVSPMALMIGLSVSQGFMGGFINATKNSVGI